MADDRPQGFDPGFQVVAPGAAGKAVPMADIEAGADAFGLLPGQERLEGGDHAGQVGRVSLMGVFKVERRMVGPIAERLGPGCGGPVGPVGKGAAVEEAVVGGVADHMIRAVEAGDGQGLAQAVQSGLADARIGAAGLEIEKGQMQAPGETGRVETCGHGLVPGRIGGVEKQGVQAELGRYMAGQMAVEQFRPPGQDPEVAVDVAAHGVVIPWPGEKSGCRRICRRDREWSGASRKCPWRRTWKAGTDWRRSA